ncbi:piggyBac transposable element-derived protein 4-like [Aricia agestis]|uniref:piggyBac transposable element-derived protein 4-like n=1 Tax=Aricia agestis TaxID=91739 RepID=UPI001C2058EC|nr:piggyBac transposable element-derived protein 4-like [Aricia agestis]
MSNWRADQDPPVAPADFLELLYEDEVELSGEEGESDGSEMIETDLEDEGEDSDRDISLVEAPLHSVTSPERRERLSRMNDPTTPPRRAVSRERSRSPLSFSSESATITVPAEGLVLLFDEFGTPLDEQTPGDEFFAPDTHPLYVIGERGRDERNRRGTTGRRGGRRGVRGVRGQSARGGEYPNRGHRGGRRWQTGQPLREIWLHDDDVPPELLSLAMDVLRRRQMRLQGDAVVDSTERGRVASESEDEDEFVDASDGADALYSLERQNFDFEWYPMDTFEGQEHNFQPNRTGSVRYFDSAYDAFRSYWSDEVLGLIVAETNLYASKISSASFQADWFPTNLHEILCLFSFWMMLGIVRLPTATSCFSVDPLLKTEVFRRIFTRRRYEMLSRALHFVDSDPVMDNKNPSNTGARSLDRLRRLRPILTHLNSAFKSNYILSKDICIDESLTLWKGRLKFKQYIRNKASKFGIKTFELCESTTGYLWSFIVYTGKQSATDLEQSPGVPKSAAVVKKLISPLLNKGYRLFMDNWYNSPLLARFLKLNGTDCVGTLRSSHRDVPIVINKAPLNRGEYIARHSGDVTVLSWQDKKRVTMISTCHGSSTALPTVSSRPLSRTVAFKPQVVLDYNKYMGGVDLKDQMLEPYLLERKRCKKWYMKLFKRLLNVSILNSRILVESSTHKHHDHLAYRLQLVDTILSKHLSHCPQTRRYTASSSRSTHLQPNRFVHSTHWPVSLGSRKRCFVCLKNGKKNIRTSYCCESCRVPLCVEDCFKAYHTSPAP